MEKRIYEDGIELWEEGNRLGRISFSKKDGILTILSTFVDPIARGRGLAGTLVEEVLSFAFESNYKVASECSYASSYIRKKETSHG